jgi:hypothetical protein
MRFDFEGTLTARDCKRHIPHVIHVTENNSQIEIQLHFTPKGQQRITNMVTLTLFDPQGFRGAGHRGGNQHTVRIDAREATPGYMPGPLPAGEWVVQLDTHMIMPGEALHYTLTVTTAGQVDQTAHQTQAVTPATLAPKGPGWYLGDLHSHTDHSDARQRVTELVASAHQAGLDFIFLTDHNTLSGLPEMYAAASDDLLTLGGVELTTFWGHALCLGAREWVDWRVRPGSGDMARIARETYARGQLFVIAHPQAIGDPACTGCTWRYPEMLPGAARLVEIWNGPWASESSNEQALSLWYDWLNQGLRLVATAGTDTHNTRDYAAKPGFNCIYAAERSESALLQALAAGHLYLSSGPRLTFSAQTAGGQQALLGDAIHQPATLRFTWGACPADAQMRVVANGRTLVQAPCGAAGVHQWPVTPADAHWYVVELRSQTGELLAITNPIFLEAVAQ